MNETITFCVASICFTIIVLAMFYYSQKEMVCELHKRKLRVRSDSNSSL